jgi:hypothetical protein
VVQRNRSSSPKWQSLSASQHRPPPTATMPARPHSHRLGLTPRRWQFYVAHQGHFQGIRHRTAAATLNISPSPPATMPCLRRHRPPRRQLCPVPGDTAHTARARASLDSVFQPGTFSPVDLTTYPPRRTPRTTTAHSRQFCGTTPYHSLRSRVRSASVEELVTSGWIPMSTGLF